MEVRVSKRQICLYFVVFLPMEISWFLQPACWFQNTRWEAGKMSWPWWLRKFTFGQELYTGMCYIHKHKSPYEINYSIFQWNIVDFFKWFICALYYYFLIICVLSPQKLARAGLLGPRFCSSPLSLKDSNLLWFCQQCPTSNNPIRSQWTKVPPTFFSSKFQLDICHDRGKKTQLLFHADLKGSESSFWGDLLTELQYNMHNYVNFLHLPPLILLKSPHCSITIVWTVIL